VGLGFQKVGIVPAEALIPEQARLSESLARGITTESAGFSAIAENQHLSVDFPARDRYRCDELAQGLALLRNDSDLLKT